MPLLLRIYIHILLIPKTYEWENFIEIIYVK